MFERWAEHAAAAHMAALRSSMPEIGLTRSKCAARVVTCISRTERRQGRNRPMSRHRNEDTEIMMSPEQKDLVRATWTMVAPIADTAAGVFYDRLFAIDKSTRPMFAMTNMADQRRKLMQALAFVINGLDRTEQLLPTIEGLGRGHVRYGVTEKHYDSVGAALLWTLEQGLKDAWTPAVRDAWIAAYVLVAGVMKNAATAETKATA
jgi:hemoglobin-like flavoprotein